MTDLDTNLDGYVDQTAYDTTGEGVADTWHLDTNFDGYFDQSAIDSGGDAIADTWQLDQDQDGLVDSITRDAVCTTPSKGATPSLTTALERRHA